MIHAIIIDDERTSRDTLRKMLERYCPELTVIAEADGYQKGLEVLRQLSPDVLFLDVQMPDGSGFKLLESLQGIDFEVIFTTAYDSYAIQAIRFSALDYLLKPIDAAELKEAVEKVKKIKEKPAVNKKVEVLIDSLQRPERFPERVVLHTADTIHVVDSSSIVRCESDDYYTRFYFKDESSLLISKTLKDVEEMLTPHHFIRVHKSHLVNIIFIRSFDKSSGGILLENGVLVPVSRRKKENLHSLLQQFGEI